tara:strand:- start:1371 stop:3218 length:1848 start_codon:yes stop_codon:yes gene_type:complete
MVSDFKTQILDLVGDQGDDNALKQFVLDGCQDVVRRVSTANPLLLEQFASESSPVTTATTDIDETIRKIHMVYRNRTGEAIGSELLSTANQGFESSIAKNSNASAVDGEWIDEANEPTSNLTITATSGNANTDSNKGLIDLSDGTTVGSIALKVTGLSVDKTYRFLLHARDGTSSSGILGISVGDTWDAADVSGDNLTLSSSYADTFVDFIASSTVMYLRVALGASTGTNAFIDDLSLKEIDFVTQKINCRKVTPTVGKLMATNPRSIYYSSTVHDPIYYVHNELLNIYPAPTSTDVANYTFIPEYTVTNFDSSTTSIDGFPLSYYDHVITYAAMMSAQRQMRDKENKLPNDVVLPVFSAPTLETINSLTLPVAPNPPALPSIASPGVDDVTISNLGIPPSYTTPTIQGSSDELTDIATGEIGSSETDVEKWFHVVGQYIEDEEDTELAQVQLGKISTYINAYQAEVQNQLNKFNKENAEYQVKLNEAQTQAQLNQQKAQKEADLTFQASIQDYQLELQKYQADVSKYQAEVSSAVQKWSNEEISNKMQEWTTEYANRLTEFANELQARVSQHSRKLEKTSAEYKFLQQQYDMLYRKYETMFATEGLSTLQPKGG